MTKYYYLSSSGFIEMPITVIYPINSTFGIDGGTDTMQLSFYCSQDFYLPIDTPVRIVNGDDIRDFAVKDSDYNDMIYANLTTNQNERLCTVTLTEPLEIARGYRLQPCKFAENQYTIQTALDRIKTLSRFDFDYNLSSNIANDPIKTRLEFASTNVYLALYEFARMYDSIPYFTLNATKNKWVLNFQSQTGEEKQYDISILDNSNQVLNHGEGVGKKVYMEANNVSFTEPIEILNASYITTDDAPSFKEDLSNFALEVDGIIKNLEELTIFGQQIDWNNTTDTGNPIQNDPYNTSANAWVLKNAGVLNYYVYSADGTGERLQNLEVVVSFCTKSDYDNLSTDVKDDIRHIIIYYENNKIYLADLYKLFYRYLPVSPDDTPDNQNLYHPKDVTLISKTSIYNSDGSPTITYGTIFAESDPNFWGKTKRISSMWDNNVKIVAHITLNKTIPIFIQNNSQYDDTVFFNQTSSEINLDKSTRVLQSYIDNMSSETLIKTKIFNDWSDIPKEGEIIVDGDKRYIVNSLSITQEREFYSCTFSLTQYHAKKREYMEADTSIVLSKIPTEDIIETYYLDKYIFKYSIDEDFPKTLYQSAFKNNYIHNFLIPQTSLKNLIMWTTFDSFGVNIDSLFNQHPLSFTGGNNIFFCLNAKNNFIWNMGINDKGNLTPNYYADENGVMKQAIFELADSDNNQWFISSLNGNPIKDRYETLHYTLQLNYKGINDTIITDDFVKCILNGIQNNAKIFVYGRKHKPNEPIDMTYGVDVGNLITEVDKSKQIITFSVPEQNIYYFSLIITVDNKPVLVKNYNEAQHKINSVKLYYSIENGYPVQTGVRPHNN